MEKNKFYQIKNITEREYTLVSCNGSVITRPIQDVDNSASVFTIQDAKGGDVLTTKDAVFIFKRMDVAGLSLCDSYCDVIGNSNLGLGFAFPIQTVHPATKKQCELLFSKMKEAGYEWDAEKKELKNIKEQNPTEDNCKISDCVEKVDMTEYNKGFECGKQRVLKYPEDFDLCKKTLTAWSEEDEEMIVGLNNCLDELEKVNGWQYTYINNKDVELNKIRNWLKSLKERVQPKQKCDWSDEDEARYYGVLETEQYMLDVVNGIKKFDVGNEQIKEECTKELAWLKSLKERMKGE